MKKILITILFLSVFFSFPQKSYSQTRYATCDLCGYCVGNKKPSSWESCRQCIYEKAKNEQETRVINAEENTAPTPYPGRYFTMLGCFKTNLTDFTQQGSAGSVVQTLLKTVFSIAGGVAFLYILFGAYQVATSQNNPERLNYGKRLIVGAIVGLIISLSSIFIINLIANNILKIPGFSQ